MTSHLPVGMTILLGDAKTTPKKKGTSEILDQNKLFEGASAICLLPATHRCVEELSSAVVTTISTSVV